MRTYDTTNVIYVALSKDCWKFYAHDEVEWTVTANGDLNVTAPRIRPGPLDKKATYAKGQWLFIEHGPLKTLRDQHKSMYK